MSLLIWFLNSDVQVQNAEASSHSTSIFRRPQHFWKNWCYLGKCLKFGGSHKKFKRSEANYGIIEMKWRGDWWQWRRNFCLWKNASEGRPKIVKLTERKERLLESNCKSIQSLKSVERVIARDNELLQTTAAQKRNSILLQHLPPSSAQYREVLSRPMKSRTNNEAPETVEDREWLELSVMVGGGEAHTQRGSFGKSKDGRGWMRQARSNLFANVAKLIPQHWEKAKALHAKKKIKMQQGVKGAAGSKTGSGWEEAPVPTKRRKENW